MGDHDGFVYVFLRADGLRKVGWTINVKRRRTILSYERGIRHTVERFWPMGDWAAVLVESEAHSILRPLRVNDHGLEVYDATLQEVVDAVEAGMEHVRQTNPAGLEARYPFPPSPPAPPGPTQQEIVLAEAAAWIEAHPEEYEALLRRYEEIGKEYVNGE